MKNINRKNKKYNRRKYKREQKIKQDYNELNLENDFYSFQKLFYYGLKCQKNVCWKRSVQIFKSKLFTTTGILLKNLKNNILTRLNYDKFTIMERGKKRKIAAPRVYDRQVDKAVTQEILLPIYQKHMIYDNGASLQGKGFHFSIKRLKQDLVKFYKKYGREGGILLIDFSDYFGSSKHSIIKQYHEKYFLDIKIQQLLWNSVEPNFNKPEIQSKIGMPLGVEPSQAEMIHYPSLLDRYIQCQLQLGMSGHYMDDYRVLIPPDRNWKEILDKIEIKATSLGLKLNRKKTYYVPLTKPFRYCKIRFKMTETGKIITKGSKKSSQVILRKIKMFKREIDNRNRNYFDLMAFASSSLGYFDNWNDSKRKGKLMYIFKKTFGFEYNDIFMYHYKNFRLNNPQLFEKISSFQLSSLGYNKKYICCIPFSGESLFGTTVVINKGETLYSRDGMIIFKNQLICFYNSELCHNHFFINDDKKGKERGRLIIKIKQQMKYTIKQKNFTRNREWEKVNSDKLALSFRHEKSTENNWVWKENLYEASPEDLRKVLKLIDKRIYNIEQL